MQFNRSRRYIINKTTAGSSTKTFPLMLRCINSPEHLRDPNGSEYILDVNLESRSSEQESQQFIEAVEEMFPGATVVEIFGRRIVFRISQNDVGPLSRVFAWLEEGTCTYTANVLLTVFFSLYDSICGVLWLGLTWAACLGSLYYCTRCRMDCGWVHISFERRCGPGLCSVLLHNV